MSVKDRAIELYRQHIELAATDGRLFRKTVMEQLMAETGCTPSSAATHYNTAKKAMPVEGLGRQGQPAAANKPSSKAAKKQALVPDHECYSVLELTDNTVGRYQSFILRGDASEKFDEKVAAWPQSTWVMIQGLGPNSGDNYRLEPEERELNRYEPAAQPVDNAQD